MQYWLQVDGKEETYELLNLLDFTSDRKRMTVVLRFPDEQIRALMKGADTMVMARIKKVCACVCSYELCPVMGPSVRMHVLLCDRCVYGTFGFLSTEKSFCTALMRVVAHLHQR